MSAANRLLRTARTILLLVIGFAAWPGAAGTDLHHLWDDRCAECHGHSGNFTRKFLRVDEGRLLGRHHGEGLQEFMRHHYLRADAVDAVYQMLLAQALTAPRFKQECSRCHDSAASLLRDTAVLHEDGSLGLLSGQSMRQFLQGHRGLQPEDVEFYVKLLTRVAIELGQP